jgi:hypothetical protein
MKAFIEKAKPPSSASSQSPSGRSRYTGQPLPRGRSGPRQHPSGDKIRSGGLARNRARNRGKTSPSNQPSVRPSRGRGRVTFPFGHRETSRTRKITC